jgi:hypothetical protein
MQCPSCTHRCPDTARYCNACDVLLGDGELTRSEADVHTARGSSRQRDLVG